MALDGSPEVTVDVVSLGEAEADDILVDPAVQLVLAVHRPEVGVGVDGRQVLNGQFVVVEEVTLQVVSLAWLLVHRHTLEPGPDRGP